jgi:hypothetical protein
MLSENLASSSPRMANKRKRKKIKERDCEGYRGRESRQRKAADSQKGKEVKKRLGGRRVRREEERE